MRSGMLTARPSSPTFCSRRSRSRVVSPTMPSTLSPALRWNSVTATSSSGREDAVHGPAVETQLVEPALQIEDVVARACRARADTAAGRPAGSRPRPVRSRCCPRPCRRRRAGAAAGTPGWRSRCGDRRIRRRPSRPGSTPGRPGASGYRPPVCLYLLCRRDASIGLSERIPRSSVPVPGR